MNKQMTDGVFWMQLIGKEYVYIGDTHESNTNGEIYKMIDFGEHWFTSWGEGVWMTTDEHPDTTDSDYGCFYSYKSFHKYFVSIKQEGFLK